MINLLNFSLLLCVFLHLYLFFIKNHLLSSLLVLEAMVLMLLLITISFSYLVLESLSLFLFVLTLSVCEAALGLTLLICFVKVNGSDHIKGNFSM
uniref:NADH-ubiquinone oxidoreductase chain 4L n=1 Tax=Zaptyx daemonorum TaxID=1885783 RepID=A0A224ACC0_9EUPU|nr:NADH dehydrogenase subunit 4L [Zaptyx daemonorum]